MPTQHIVATRHNVQDPCRMRLPKVVPGTAVASVEGCGKASARCYNLVGARGAPHHWGRADMRAEILSVGTELLLGHITDTNAAYLAQQLTGLGIDLYYVSQVGDNLDRLTETLRRGRARPDLLLPTGGRGPAKGDFPRGPRSAVRRGAPPWAPRRAAERPTFSSGRRHRPAS